MTQTQKDKSSHKDKNSGHIHTDPKLILQANCTTELKPGQPVYYDEQLQKYLPAISERSNVKKSFIQGIVWGFIGTDKFYLRVQPGPMEYRMPLTAEYFTALKPSVIVNNSLIPGDYGSPLWLSESVPGGLSADPPLTGPKVIIGYKTDYGFIYRPKSIVCCSDDPPPESSSSSSSSFPTLIIDNGLSNCYITVQSTNTKPECKWQRPEIIDVLCSEAPQEIFGWRKDPVNDCIGIQKVKILENCVDDNCGDFLVGPVLDQFLDAMGLPGWIPTNAACVCEEKCYITFMAEYNPVTCQWPFRATSIDELCTSDVQATFDWKKDADNDCIGLKKVIRNYACAGDNNKCMDVNTFGPGEYDAFLLDVGQPDWTPTDSRCKCDNSSSSSSSSSSVSENVYKVVDRWRAICSNSSWTVAYMGTWCVDSTTTQFDVWEDGIFGPTCLRYYYKEIIGVSCAGPEGPINEQEDPPQFTPPNPEDIPPCCIASSSSSDSSSSSSSSVGPCTINCSDAFSILSGVGPPYLDVTSGDSIAIIFDGLSQTINVSYYDCVNDANFGNFIIPYNGGNNNFCNVGANLRIFVNDSVGKKYSGWLSDAAGDAIIPIKMVEPSAPQTITNVCPGTQYPFDSGALTWGVEASVPNITGGFDDVMVCGPYNFRAAGNIQNSSGITFDGAFADIGASWGSVTCDENTDPLYSTVTLTFGASTVYVCNGQASNTNTNIGSAELIVDGGSPITLDMTSGSPELTTDCVTAKAISQASDVILRLYTGTDIDGKCPLPDHSYSGYVDLAAATEIPYFECCCCQTNTDSSFEDFYTDCTYYGATEGVKYLRFGTGIMCGEIGGYIGARVTCDGVDYCYNVINTANGTLTIGGINYPIAADPNGYIIATVPCSALPAASATVDFTVVPNNSGICNAPSVQQVSTISNLPACDCVYN